MTNKIKSKKDGAKNQMSYTIMQADYLHLKNLHYSSFTINTAVLPDVNDFILIQHPLRFLKKINVTLLHYIF